MAKKRPMSHSLRAFTLTLGASDPRSACSSDLTDHPPLRTLNYLYKLSWGCVALHSIILDLPYENVLCLRAYVPLCLCMYPHLT